MIAAHGSGDLDAAREANDLLFRSYDFESSDAFPNPLPAKAACRALGLPSGQCRLPLGEAPRSLDDDARALIDVEQCALAAPECADPFRDAAPGQRKNQ